MDRIARNSSNVVCPVIRSINDKTFQINMKNNKVHVGGFSWNLQVIKHLPVERHNARHALHLWELLAFFSATENVHSSFFSSIQDSSG